MHLYIILLTFFLSVIFMPIIIIVSKKFNLYDRIDNRKVHTGQISRLGGIGITLAFTTAMIIFYLNGDFSTIKQNILFLIPAAICITITGIIDDLVDLRALLKLFIQMITAGIVIAGGFHFTGLSFGPLQYYLNFGIFAYPITFIWIIGVTNAVNLMDGIDGLAGTISFIAGITYGFFFYRADNLIAMYVCFAFAAAIAGFLVFNLPIPKAKLFMGDGGSTFLGFVLSVLPLLSSKGSIPTISLPYAFIVLMIPIFDTFASIWRRKREHRSFTSPDKFHLHHKLMLLGFSNRATLVIIDTLQIVISIFLTCAIWLGGYFSVILVFTVLIMGVLFFTVIHYGKEKAITNSEEK